MIFDREIDETLSIILNNNCKNSLEIAKFIKNLPQDFILLIREKICSLNTNDNSEITYNKVNTWYYSCKISKGDTEKNIFIGKYLKDNSEPVFYISISAFNDYSLRELRNFSIRKLGKCVYTTNNKYYLVNYYLKKFPSEYLISGDILKFGSMNGHRYNNTIEKSKVSNDIDIKDLDSIIQDKIRIRKRNNNKR